MSNEASANDEGIEGAELLRKMLQISPDDAEDVRRDSPATPARTRRKNAGSSPGEGPSADYGDK